MSTKLTKKQQKAAAFRSGEYKTKEKKLKKAASDDTKDAEDGKDTETKSKKRKRVDRDAGNVGNQNDNQDADIPNDQVAAEPAKDSSKVSKKQSKSSAAKKVKLSHVSKGDTESQNDKKQRFILFVGNLPFDVGVDDIKGHFTDKKSSSKGPSSVRLLTTKTNGKGPAKSKGCAFLEFANPAALQRALEYHHTEYNGRKINVELSAGGGGNSHERREKIRAKNEVVDKERAETLEKKKAEKAKTLESSTSAPPTAIHASRANLLKQQASQAKKSAGSNRTPARSTPAPKRGFTGANAISLQASSRS